MALRSESTNPLVEIIRERNIERPDSLAFRPVRGNARNPKLNGNPLAGAISKLGALLSEKGHRWNLREKEFYRRAIRSTKHPCCPTCGKPMNESVTTAATGLVHKSWYCERDQNL